MIDNLVPVTIAAVDGVCTGGGLELLLLHPDLPNEIRWLPVVELLHIITGAPNVSAP
jgi:hypothetical protein